MNILGINGGNGVLLYPMKKYLVGNIETRSIFHTPQDIQWELNFGNIPLVKKPNLYEFLTSAVDVIVGAPNCGHSSVLAYSRAKKLSDPGIDKSFQLYWGAIEFFKPKVFMMENLPKALELFTKDFLEEQFKEYQFIYHECSVMEWGNSQKNRIRLVIIGINISAFNKNLKEVRYHFNNIYKISQLKTSGELLEGLGDEDIEKGHIREDIDDIITLYAGYKNSLKNIQKYWLKDPELKRYETPEKRFSTAPGVYRNPYNSYPATARKANRQFNHQGLQMSPRELARVQGVPDRFRIHIDPNKRLYWINKGRATVTKCPPYQIGKWFYKQLKITQKLWA